MLSTHRFALFCLALLTLVALSGQAFSASVAVGTCTALPKTYTTIQAAVTASPAGTIIEVCPGTYPEQVVIPKKLTIEGVASGTQDAAVIVPPVGGVVANATDFDSATPIAAQVLVHVASGVKLNNLTIDGTGNQLTCNGTDLIGILFQNASGTVVQVAVRSQIPGDVLSACQAGESIWIETSAGSSSKVLVEFGSVHNYNKNGITGVDAGTALTVTGEYVQGSGLSAVAAQNGVQLGYGASGSVGSSTVSDNNYYNVANPPYYVASDILLIDTAENDGVKVYDNQVSNSNLPIGIETDTPGTYGDGVSVTTNHVSGTSVYDGIDICTNGNTVTGNTVVNSAESGIHLDAACGGTGNNNTATGNTFIEGYCAGILADPGTAGNTTTSETYWTVPFTITSSAASCTIPLGPLRDRITRKVSPKR